MNFFMGAQRTRDQRYETYVSFETPHVLLGGLLIFPSAFGDHTAACVLCTRGRSCGKKKEGSLVEGSHSPGNNSTGRNQHSSRYISAVLQTLIVRRHYHPHCL